MSNTTDFYFVVTAVEKDDRAIIYPFDLAEDIESSILCLELDELNDDFDGAYLEFLEELMDDVSFREEVIDGIDLVDYDTAVVYRNSNPNVNYIIDIRDSADQFSGGTNLKKYFKF